MCSWCLFCWEEFGVEFFKGFDDGCDDIEFSVCCDKHVSGEECDGEDDDECTDNEFCKHGWCPFLLCLTLYFYST